MKNTEGSVRVKGMEEGTEQKFEHKKGCGFREKIKVCHFNPKDCNSNKCDMYDIGWSEDAIKTAINSLSNDVKNLFAFKNAMEKEGTDRTEKAKYKEIMAKLGDSIYGIEYLSLAYVNVTEGGRCVTENQSRMKKIILKRAMKKLEISEKELLK